MCIQGSSLESLKEGVVSSLCRNLGEVEGETCEDENEEDPSH